MAKGGINLLPGIPAERRFMNCHEAASKLAVSADHVQNLCAAGHIAAEELPGRKPRSLDRWRIPVLALADFLARRTVRPTLNADAEGLQTGGNGFA